MVELNGPKIYFISSDHENAGVKPEVAAKTLPNWYKDHPRYNEEKDPTWRNCVPFFDVMTSGYMLLTPCDIAFGHDGTRPTVKVLNSNFENFVELRAELSNFQTPLGCYSNHFAWLPRWGVSLQDGYSALYTNPFNRFELPFIGASGIIDNDKMNTPGRMPFFVKEGWTGVLPKGTPFVQILPFKREDWTLVNVEANEVQVRRNLKRSVRFRSVKSDYYRDHSWSRKKYKISDNVQYVEEDGEQNA